MTVLFWFILIMMALIAVLFIAIPLFKKPSLKPASKSAILVILCLPIFAFLLYLHWGSSEKLKEYWVIQDRAEQVKQELAKYKNPQQVINRLKAHLNQFPNSAKGWYLLGRIYLTTQHYHQSVKALAKANRLDPNNIKIATVYAQALFFDNHRQLSKKALMLLERVVSQSPNNINANNLLAINAYNQGHYQQAIEYWEKLLPLFEPGSKDSQALLSMIARAEKQLKQ